MNEVKIHYIAENKERSRQCMAIGSLTSIVSADLQFGRVQFCSVTYIWQRAN